MDKLLFVHIEIKHVLEVLDFIKKDDKRKLMAVIANLHFEKLLAVLKVLYRIERDYFQFMHDDIIETDNIIKKLYDKQKLVKTTRSFNGKPDSPEEQTPQTPQ